MHSKKHSIWKSKPHIILFLFCGGAYALAGALETQLPGDSEWYGLYSLVFIASGSVACISPTQLRAAVMAPCLSVLAATLCGCGGMFFMISLLLVLMIAAAAAVLGFAVRSLFDVVWEKINDHQPSARE